MWRLIFVVVIEIGCAEVDDRYYPATDSAVDAGVGFDAGSEVPPNEPKQQ